MAKESNDFILQPVDYDPFDGPELVRVAPATEPQSEIFVSCLIGGEDANRSYNESVTLRLSGKLNVSALQYALQGAIDRHEALRAVFSPDGKKMCILGGITNNLMLKDISALSVANQHLVLKDYANYDAQTAYDLKNGPLFRTALFCLAPNLHQLTFSAHHIVCDGWSLGIILQDISKIYNAELLSVPLLPEAVTRFSDYAVGQLNFELTTDYQEIERYWLSQLGALPPVLDIPTDFPRPLTRTYQSQRDDYELSTDVTMALRKVGSQAGCSFVTTLIASFEVYLHRLSGQDEIILGLPAAGQSATGLPALVGHCVNLLPMMSRYDGDLSFSDYLRDRKGQILDDYDHQQITFGSLLKKLNITRDPSRVPLIPVVLNIDMGLDKGVAFEGLSHKLIYNPRQYENFEIFLNISGSDDQLTLEWSYNTRLFKPATIRKMMFEFEQLLQTLVKQPGTKLSDLAISGRQELYAQLKEWNNTTVVYPAGQTLIQLIDATCAQYSAKAAITFQGQAITYEQLHHQTNQLAHLLKEAGVDHGDIVGMMVERSIPMVVSLIAIMKAGAAYVPVDPELPTERINYMLTTATAKYCIVSSQYAEKIIGDCRLVNIEKALEQLSRYPAHKVDNSLIDIDLAYIIFTSGSTGKPKGVMVEHHSLLNLLLSMQQQPGIRHTDKFLALTTISFDISGLEILLPLITGAELVIAGKEDARDGRLLMNMLLNQQITIVQATPASWRMMLDAAGGRMPIKALCGGEAMTTDLANALTEHCLEVWNMYGPTETTIWSAVKQILPTDKVVTIGRPINNTRIYVLDANRNPVGIGAVGHIYIAGDGVARGYMGNPELTNTSFLPDIMPAKAGDRMYNTGDLGKFEENGALICLGRSDLQLKINGYRVEPGEIEACLLQQTGIRQAAVVAVNNRLIAYVAADDGTGVDGWKQHLQLLLPNYMIPADFVLVDKMPITANGKLDRLALQQAGFAPRQGAYRGATNEMEQAIVDIWTEIFDGATIGVNDDFFELGGHSLLAFQAMSRLGKRLNKSLPVVSIFQFRTVAQLAAFVSGAGEFIMEALPTIQKALVPLKAEGSKTPLYIVHGYDMNVLSFTSVATHMDADQPVFGLQAVSLNDINGEPVAMEQVAAEYIAEMVAQHPSGAFAIAGYSFGGYIAFEIARQLKQMGRQVKMLAMFDAYAYNEADDQPGAKKIGRKILRQFPKSLFILNSFIKQPKETIEYQKYILKERFKNIAGIDDKDKDEQERIAENKVYQRYEYAYHNYKMGVYDGAIDLFRVKTRLYFLDDMKFLGWKPYAQKGVIVHEIPGDHKTFIMAPNNKEFARILQNALDAG